MKNKLQAMLLAYLKENNPTLLKELAEDDALQAWVLEKIKAVESIITSSQPSQVLEAQCMDIMTADLRPSRMRYIRDLLEERFSVDYDRMIEAGTLTYELLEITALCHGHFEDMPLIEGMENPALDRKVVLAISTYLHENIFTV